jgi:hypothetical protein
VRDEVDEGVCVVGAWRSEGLMHGRIWVQHPGYRTGLGARGMSVLSSVLLRTSVGIFHFLLLLYAVVTPFILSSLCTRTRTLSEARSRSCLHFLPDTPVSWYAQKQSSLVRQANFLSPSTQQIITSSTHSPR